MVSIFVIWLCNELVELSDFYLGKGWDAKLIDPVIWKRVEKYSKYRTLNVHLNRKSRLLSNIPNCNFSSEYLTIGFGETFC